jgi:hypothetical protein
MTLDCDLSAMDIKTGTAKYCELLVKFHIMMQEQRLKKKCDIAKSLHT